MSSSNILLSCDGENESKHPKVFITFKKDSDRAICGYCNKIFLKKDLCEKSQPEKNKSN
jgi:uncharacterized Zn-finger protein